MKNFISKLPANIKLTLSCSLGLILVAIIYYPLIPILLNYPPDSINNSFQIEVNFFSYTTQYFVIVAIVVFICLLLFPILFRRINKLDKLKNLNMENTPNLLKTIKTCFNYPFVVLLTTLLFPPLMIFFLLIFLKQEFSLTIKLTFILFTMTSLIALFSYSISKWIFEGILKKIGIKDSTYGLRINIKNKLLIQLMPLLVFTVLFSFLILYSQITSNKGDSLFDYYKQALESEFGNYHCSSVEEAKNLLNSIELKSSSDSIFILNSDGSTYYSDSPLSDFFIKYALEYEYSHHGHTYDYYANPTQGSFIRYNINGTDYLLGIKYSVFSNDVLSSVLPLFLVLLIINAIFVYYTARTLKNDIKVISNNLSNISKNSNTYINHKLSVLSNDEIGDLTIAFNKIQDLTKKNIEQIHSSQETIVEKERLASLGQMIGGIAHNLKTPIMSISGATEGISDLIKEYENSVGDPEVTIEDHHAIAGDMAEWIDKIRVHLEYMSDVITAIKGQAVAFSEQTSEGFTVEELVKNIDILMRHELSSALINLDKQIDIDSDTKIKGNINSLVQVINNIISNGIQAYNGKENETIQLSFYKENESLIIKIEDRAGGLPEIVKQKLFKEMITTKGKNGTGLGLFMSYSNIKAHFNGKMRFETETGKGTAFYIEIPL